MVGLYSGLTTIGITGTIGSGKSTVGTILKELSIPVIDSDEIVHNLLATSAEVQDLVVERFGPGVIISKPGSSAHQIDRKALGRIIFKDPAGRADLEKILHPRVRDAFRRQLEQFGKDPSIKLVGCLVPLLFEAGLRSEYDQTWAVVTDDTVLKDRLKKREGFSLLELEQRLAAQWPQEKKSALADKVINNSGDLEETRKQVLDLVNQLLTVQTAAPPASSPDGK
jgi:dephospho-CoA kinase